MKTVFIVDNDNSARVIAKTALDGTYKAFALPGADRMMKLADKITPDLVLLDISMHEVDSFQSLIYLKSNAKLNSVPVIFMTGRHDPEMELRGFQMGAIDFIHKPFSIPILLKRVESLIGMNQIFLENKLVAHQLHNATVSVICDVLEKRDEKMHRHVERIQIFLRILVNELIDSKTYLDEISGWDLSLVLPAAQFHDVGKIRVSDSILNSTEKLSSEELNLLKRHCIEGEKIISMIIDRVKDDGFFHHAMMFAGYHHEKWNGSGYPRGLTEENIPLEGRIMAIADVYDALVSERPYRKSFSHKKAVEIIEKGSSISFDPHIVEAFLDTADNFSEACERLRGED